MGKLRGIRFAALIGIAALGHGVTPAWSCVTFGNGDCSNGAPAFGGSKWANTDPATGQSTGSIAWGTGAVITWSFMDPSVGVGGNPNLSNFAGANQLGTNSSLDIENNINATNGANAFQTAVASAFDVWSAAANVKFVEVADDGALAGNAASSGSAHPAPDIRIGAFAFNNSDGSPDAFTGGVGFGPPGNVISFPDPLSGVILLNTRNNFEIDP
ncbi:MAG: hypothetical protein ACREU6_03750, partial [Steroidobacteraceae bacterium]